MNKITSFICAFLMALISFSARVSTVADTSTPIKTALLVLQKNIACIRNLVSPAT